MAKPTSFKQIAVSLAFVASAVMMSPQLVTAQAVAAAPATKAAKPKSQTPARATAPRSTSSRNTALKNTALKNTAAKKKAYSASTARARRAALARARAEARVRELRELQTPRFTVDEYGREIPDVRAEAAVIYDPESGEVLWESHSKDERSIASITKVMTALVFLESGAPVNQMVTVQRSDVARASTTYLRHGFQLTAEDLLNLLLVGSDNAAARALARISPMGYEGFIESMNIRAKSLGLESTTYADPSGLMAENTSSAYDQARLIAYAAANERIGEIMRKTSYTTHVGKRMIQVNSTNQIVRSGDIDVVAGKTGFISRSGYCLATLLRLPQSGKTVAFVVLGAKSNASRFWETRHLFNWMATRTKALLDGDFQNQQQQEEEQLLVLNF
ncbi:MAG TPA: serine hydrolase [Vicinamibacterales bacterium]|nr:serine hydrolase [Vicinamibacterales bacterium]